MQISLLQVYRMFTGKVGNLPFPENAPLVRDVAAEGMVLLENDGVLPLKNKKVALYGVGAFDTYTCGTGSGYVSGPYSVSIYDGFKNAGFEITTEAWLKEQVNNYAQEKKNHKASFIEKIWGGEAIKSKEPELTDSDLSVASGSDTAVYVIHRNTGENFDRKEEKGDWYLTDIEEINIKKIKSHFKNIVVVLNTCAIDTTFLREMKVNALVLMCLAGMESGNALVDILNGKVTPSGKLTGTWAKKYKDYPASATFSANDGDSLQEDYNEDIYVGYRYFDTFGIEPAYPFGYGLSYTTFERTIEDIKVDWENIKIKVAVKNTGNCSGKEVIQVYTSAPQGKLRKPYQELKAYGKTKLLGKNETEVITVTLPTRELSSYDTDISSYIMEAGEYLIRVGTNSRETTIAGSIRLDQTVVTRKVSQKCKPDRELNLIIPPEIKEEKPDSVFFILNAADCKTIDEASKIENKSITYVNSNSNYVPATQAPIMPHPSEEIIQTVRSCPDSTLVDVKNGKVTMEEFVASLDLDTLLRLVTGIGSETKYKVPVRQKLKVHPVKSPSSSGATTAQYVKSLGIPNTSLTDGPAGLHLMGCAVTAFPVGMLIAQTWNTDAAKNIGDAFGKEMDYYKTSIVLGPGMNIHRDPLCGRCFEYYSEDPIVTGITAASYILGVQSHKGRGVSVKHFCANNQETDRSTSNSSMSERALREIYLKGFEIAVKEAKPMTVMSSYNKINGVHTSSNYELLMDILRGEWGFDGYVMTDWGSRSSKPFDMHAGNNMIMGGEPVNNIGSAITGEKPHFNKDGSIHTDVIMEYGVMRKHIPAWNSFLPDAEGKDTIKVVVAKGKAVGKSVLKMQEEGIATIKQNNDGSKTIIYKGNNLGKYLPLGDVQRCAMGVLNTLMNSAAMEEMYQ